MNGKPLAEKKADLEEILGSIGNVAVAFSGGVDSTYLLAAAKSVLREKVVAVTAHSPSFPMRERKEAKELAESIGVRQIILETEEMKNESYRNNPVDRCYFCKDELFEKMKAFASENDIGVLAYGEIADDQNDLRPGQRAAKEHAVRWPLREAGLTKEEIRTLSKEAGLSTWDRPASACLSSRFPYGTTITAEALLQVERAEDLLLSLGFREMRVRHHDRLARIEVPAGEIGKLTDDLIREKIVDGLKALGYLYVSVDLQGFRSGSLNEGITPTKVPFGAL